METAIPFDYLKYAYHIYPLDNRKLIKPQPFYPFSEGERQ